MRLNDISYNIVQFLFRIIYDMLLTALEKRYIWPVEVILFSV